MEEQRLKIEAERLQFDRNEREETRAERKAAVALMNALAHSLMNQNQPK
jgi:hypothetical protein